MRGVLRGIIIALSLAYLGGIAAVVLTEPLFTLAMYLIHGTYLGGYFTTISPTVGGPLGMGLILFGWFVITIIVLNVVACSMIEEVYKTHTREKRQQQTREQIYPKSGVLSPPTTFSTLLSKYWKSFHDKVCPTITVASKTDENV